MISLPDRPSPAQAARRGEERWGPPAHSLNQSVSQSVLAGRPASTLSTSLLSLETGVTLLPDVSQLALSCIAGQNDGSRVVIINWHKVTRPPPPARQPLFSHLTLHSQTCGARYHWHHLGKLVTTSSIIVSLIAHYVGGPSCLSVFNIISNLGEGDCDALEWEISGYPTYNRVTTRTCIIMNGLEIINI